jgi:hypothetical protein
VAFVDSYSFSHRFTDESVDAGFAGYQEIIHQCQNVDAMALTRQFFHFAAGCGYAPKNIIDAFAELADEYGNAYGYYGEKEKG